VKGKINRRLLSIPKGVVFLDFTSSQTERICYQFESFCKKIIREHYRNIVSKLAWLAQNEVNFSEMSQQENNSLFLLDEYPIEYFYFFGLR
jgi:hypothetical protein